MMPEVRRLDGRLRWPEIAALLRAARLYVGPDTSVTHLAAASGCPTVALFGPTDPRLWGPWPARGLPTPWAASGTIQRRHNVWLVQNPLPCLPCQHEGCDSRLDSRAQCLDELSPRQVLAAADAGPRHRSRRGSAMAQRPIWMARRQHGGRDRATMMIRLTNLTPRMGLILAHDLIATAVAILASFYIRFEDAGLAGALAGADHHAAGLRRLCGRRLHDLRPATSRSGASPRCPTS